MKLDEIRAIATKRGIKAGKMKKAELVHAIQNDEGNTPCFGTAEDGQCDQMECLWREDCIPSPKAAA
jgi:hypothetical protein